MGKITVEVKINTFGNMVYSLNHPNAYFYLPSIFKNKCIFPIQILWKQSVNICIFVVKYLTLLKTIETNTKIQSMQNCTYIYILKNATIS